MEAVRVVLVVLAGTGVLGLASAVLVGRHRIRRAVAAKSTALPALRSLNQAFRSRLVSYGPITRNYFDRVDSKAKFDRFDLSELLHQSLDADEIGLVSEIEQRRTPMAAFAEYETERMRIQASELGRADFGTANKDRCLRAEARTFDRQRLRYSPPSANVVCGVGYDSPQGRNSYRKSLTLNFAELEQALGQMRALRSARSSAVNQRRTERSKMTASIRVDVLRRDGYRCRFCGADSSVAELHVDHVIPVSKGGLTELSNLQTLCADCNQGKSNRFID